MKNKRNCEKLKIWNGCPEDVQSGRRGGYLQNNMVYHSGYGTKMRRNRCCVFVCENESKKHRDFWVLEGDKKLTLGQERTVRVGRKSR